jgi:(E)-4-hydroxy-3-methylbut-2-enyl-diphosphate synthase
MFRDKTKVVKIGDVLVGGGNRIKIQSMCNTKTEDIEETVAQIKALEAVGCDITRVAVPTLEAAKSISKIKEKISIPIVADIHFDYKLALAAIENGADKIRINPGNIGSEDRIKAVVMACKAKNIPIRVGVNGGSLEKDLLAKYENPTYEALVESAINNVKLIEKYDYDNLVVSIKSSDVLVSLKAHELASSQLKYPMHLGITEAGTLFSGTIKSSVGLGLLLGNGIGDTIRVSLTGDPVEEIRVGKKILESLGLYQGQVSLVSCPTCGRTQIDLISLANEVEKRCESIHKPIKVAVMGCVVNGPGEAREADIGIAGGKGVGIIFKKGEIIKTVPEKELLGALLEEISKM